MLNRDRKISIICHSVFAVGVIALMAVAAFYDLRINHAMSDSGSLFGQIFVTLGEFPAYIILPICGTLLFYNEWKLPNKYAKIAVKCAFALLVFGGYVIWGLMGSSLVEMPNKVGQTIIYAVIFAIGSLGVGSLVKRDTAHRLVKWCVFAIAVLALSLVVVNLMKLGWGRVRYRDLLTSGSFDAFTPWYLPQGYNSGNKSFPSGHTASACNIFAFVVLFDYSEKLKKYRPLAYVGGVVFVILTALSRIVIDAHYLSDVVMGATVSYICYYVLKVAFFRNKSFMIEQDRRVDNE